MQRTRSSFRHKTSSEYITANYLKLNADKLIFELTNPNLKSITNRTLLINNPNQVPVRFKIKSTTPFHYLVRPFQGTLEPRQTIEINIKMILADRNIFKFNIDRFEILARPLQEHSDPMSRIFWEGAQSYKVSVELVQTYNKHERTQYRPIQEPKVIRQKHSDQILLNMQYQTQQLQSEVSKLKEKVNEHKLKNFAAGVINPWNFMIAGCASFLLGFIFS